MLFVIFNFRMKESGEMNTMIKDMNLPMTSMIWKRQKKLFKLKKKRPKPKDNQVSPGLKMKLFMTNTVNPLLLMRRIRKNWRGKGGIGLSPKLFR